jgi:hypothetical protein
MERRRNGTRNDDTADEEKNGDEGVTRWGAKNRNKNGSDDN